MRTEVSKEEFEAFITSRAFPVHKYPVWTSEPMCVAYAANSPDGAVLAVHEVTSESSIPGPDRYYITHEGRNALDKPDDIESVIRAACEAASAGPWKCDRAGGGYDLQDGRGYMLLSGDFGHGATIDSEGDACFISGARTWVPLLLERVRVEREQLEAARQGLNAAQSALFAGRPACAHTYAREAGDSVFGNRWCPNCGALGLAHTNLDGELAHEWKLPSL